MTRDPKISFGPDDSGRPRRWDAHAQDHWLAWAGHAHFPDYLRVVFVAYGRHAANGHAKLEREELAHYLVRRNGSLPDRRVIHSAIKKAVTLGYLLPESRSLCLVVSSHDVQGGWGSPDDRCPRDHTRKANVRSSYGRFGSNVRTDTCRSTTNVRSDDGRSTLPLSSLSTNVTTTEGDLSA